MCKDLLRVPCWVCLASLNSLTSGNSRLDANADFKGLADMNGMPQFPQNPAPLVSLWPYCCYGNTDVTLLSGWSKISRRPKSVWWEWPNSLVIKPSFENSLGPTNMLVLLRQESPIDSSGYSVYVRDKQEHEVMLGEPICFLISSSFEFIWVFQQFDKPL